MQHKLISEEQILDPNFRRIVVKEIFDTENLRRKEESYKRHQIYKDQTRKYVIEQLQKEGLKPETVAIMANRAANVSICRKVVNKLARSYQGGIIRAMQTPEGQQKLDDLVRLLNANEKMKKADRYRQLQKNDMVQVVPEKFRSIDGVETVRLKWRVFAPWSYDVIEDNVDHEIPRIVILSDYTDRNQSAQLSLIPGGDGRSGVPAVFREHSGNRREEIIADSPEDAGQNFPKLIWWSKHFHFTTDKNGSIIADKSPEDLLNPIETLPFCNVADDQDGEFWATGGEDLIDSTILINTLMTDRNSIAYVQGFGQMVVSGKNIPDRLTVGPHNAMIFSYDEGEPKPEVSFASASAPFEAWDRMTIQHVALLLSTNGLSTSTVSASLDGNNFPSGIARLIDQSEATESVEDTQKKFIDIERKLWEITGKWHNLYFSLGILDPEFSQVGEFPLDEDITIKFLPVRHAVTEKEQLENIKARKELGINTLVELIQIDNSDLTQEEAEQKLVKIQQEKMSRMAATMAQMMKPQEKATEPQEKKEEVEDDGGEQSSV